MSKTIQVDRQKFYYLIEKSPQIIVPTTPANPHTFSFTGVNLVGSQIMGMLLDHGGGTCLIASLGWTKKWEIKSIEMNEMQIKEESKKLKL